MTVAQSDREQAMLRACQRRDAPTVRRLLAAGVNVHAVTRSDVFGSLMRGYSAVHLAAEAGSATIIRDLVAYGADVQVADPELKQTALHFAASNGHLGACAALLDAAASLAAVDHQGSTALVTAAKKRHGDFCAYLLDRGAPFEPAAAHCCLEWFSSWLANALARAQQLPALQEAVDRYPGAHPVARAEAQAWLRAYAAREAARLALRPGVTP